MILRIKNCTVEVPLPSGTSISVHKQLPENFGHVTETLFRGSFPTRQHVVTMQRELGIENIVTLHSNQAAELLAVARLKQELPSNIFLHEVLLSDVPSYLMAGQLVSSLEGPSYIHCTFGANRTGKVLLVTQILLPTNYVGQLHMR